MIRVRIDLVDANSGAERELGRLHIFNDETSRHSDVGNYGVTAFDTTQDVIARGSFGDFPRLTASVFALVFEALDSVMHEIRER